MKLLSSDGSIDSSLDDIMRKLHNYYKDLYKETNVLNDADFDLFIENLDIQKLSDDDKKTCDGKMTIEECSMSIQNMKNNTSPGLDGLGPAFYKVFWIKIRHLVVNSMNYGYDVGRLSSSQRKGLIVLLLKGKDLSRLLLKNYRPIFFNLCRL
jgi:hypothetical protein